MSANSDPAGNVQSRAFAQLALDKLGIKLPENISDLRDPRKAAAYLESLNLPQLASSFTGIRGSLMRLFQACCAINVDASFDDLLNENRKIREHLADPLLVRPSYIQSKLVNDRLVKVGPFMEWLQKNGVDCSRVEINATESNGFGLRATQDIPKGAKFISVPRALMMLSEDCRKSEVAEMVIKDPLMSAMPNVLLAFYLLWQYYKDSSFYQPYLEILPSTHHNVAYFSVEDFEALRGTTCHAEAFSMWKSISRQYAYIHLMMLNQPLGEGLGILDKFCYDDYRWAMATVVSRINELPGNAGGQSRIPALVPLLDMCNHTNAMFSVDYDAATERCECVAVEDSKASSALCVFYGVRRNLHFVLQNGFFYEPNIHDYLVLKMELDPSDALLEEKTSLLKLANLEKVRGVNLSRHFPTWFGDLLVYLRVLYADEADIKVARSIPSDEFCITVSDIAQPLSRANDRRAGRALFELCEKVLKDNPGSVEDEDGILAGPLPATQRLCVQLRQAEKKILLFSIDQLKKRFNFE